MTDSTSDFTTDFSNAPFNQLSRFMFKDFAVRGLAIQLHDVWQSIHQAYDYPEAVRTLLGEAIAATGLLTGNVKFNGALKLQILGSQEADRPSMLNMLLTQCNNQMAIRGLAHVKDYGTEAGTDIDPNLLLNCTISLTMQHDDTGKNYQGLIDADTGSLSQGIEHYCTHSEQLPTRMWLFVNEHTACGFMLQRMPPEHPEYDSETDEDGWERVQHLAGTLTLEEMAALPIKDILHRLFHQERYELMAVQSVSKFCPCVDEQRVDKMLRGLGRQELEDTIAEQGEIKVNCEFCNQDFVYDPIDVEQLCNQLVVPTADRTQ